MITFDVARRFTRLPGGRKIEHGPDSGEKFLLMVLVPCWDRLPDTVVKLDFTRCVGAANCFLDASFGELASLFSAARVRQHFQVAGLAKRKDFDGILEAGEKAGKFEFPQHLKAKATEAQRNHVMQFMDWCADQDPPLHLAQHDPEDRRGYMVENVDWKPWCTKWCGVDEEAFSAEKDMLLSQCREQNALMDRSKSYVKKHKAEFERAFAGIPIPHEQA